MAGIKFPKPKSKSIKTIRNKAAYAFQRWVCLRDCEAYQKNGMFAQCISCPNIRHFKALDGGHFVEGRGDSILFEETNCHAQCRPCNGHLGKERTREIVDANYKKSMIKKYGLVEVERLEALKPMWKKYTYHELEELYHLYNNKLKEAGLR